MFSMPGCMCAGQRPAAGEGPPCSSCSVTGSPGAGCEPAACVVDVVWCRVADGLAEAGRRPRRRSARWVERHGVDRRAGRRDARRLLRYAAGLPVPPALSASGVGPTSVGREARAVLDQGAALRLVQPVPPSGVAAGASVGAEALREPSAMSAVCDVCRLVPAVRRVLFADSVLAMVCRGCAAGAVAGVAA